MSEKQEEYEYDGAAKVPVLCFRWKEEGREYRLVWTDDEHSEACFYVIEALDHDWLGGERWQLEGAIKPGASHYGLIKGLLERAGVPISELKAWEEERESLKKRISEFEARARKKEKG
jgi:hypothetical protein